MRGKERLEKRRSSVVANLDGQPPSGRTSPMGDRTRRSSRPRGSRIPDRHAAAIRGRLAKRMSSTGADRLGMVRPSCYRKRAFALPPGTSSSRIGRPTRFSLRTRGRARPVAVDSAAARDHEPCSRRPRRAWAREGARGGGGPLKSKDPTGDTCRRSHALAAVGAARARAHAARRGYVTSDIADRILPQDRSESPPARLPHVLEGLRMAGGVPDTSSGDRAPRVSSGDRSAVALSAHQRGANSLRRRPRSQPAPQPRDRTAQRILSACRAPVTSAEQRTSSGSPPAMSAGPGALPRRGVIVAGRPLGPRTVRANGARRACDRAPDSGARKLASGTAAPSRGERG